MRFLLVLAAVGLIGCGSSEGAPCATTDATECASGKSLLVCEGGKWTGYPCPSCAGGKCDWKGAVSGDSCPRIAETFGTCPFDGRQVSCFYSASADAGVFVESACSACVAGKSLEELGRCSGGKCSCQ